MLETSNRNDLFPKLSSVIDNLASKSPEELVNCESCIIVMIIVFSIVFLGHDASIVLFIVTKLMHKKTKPSDGLIIVLEVSAVHKRKANFMQYSYSTLKQKIYIVYLYRVIISLHHICIFTEWWQYWEWNRETTNCCSIYSANGSFHCKTIHFDCEESHLHASWSSFTSSGCYPWVVLHLWYHLPKAVEQLPSFHWEEVDVNIFWSKPWATPGRTNFRYRETALRTITHVNNSIVLLSVCMFVVIFLIKTMWLLSKLN